MRTTLSLDDDVAAVIERLRQARGQSLKEIVNEALRGGLRQMTGRRSRRAPFRTSEADLGRCLPGNVDDVAEVLAIGEGESFR